MTDEVPEGQLPRDAAFWATYWAVQDEMNYAERRGACIRDRSHEIVIGRKNQPVSCGRCDASWGRILADATSWRIERQSNGRPQPGDVLYVPNDVVWVEKRPRVVRQKAVVQPDGGFRVDLYPVSHPLPVGFTL